MKIFGLENRRKACSLIINDDICFLVCLLIISYGQLWFQETGYLLSSSLALLLSNCFGNPSLFAIYVLCIYMSCWLSRKPDTICARYSLCPIQFVSDTNCADTNCADTICADTICSRYNFYRYNLYMNRADYSCRWCWLLLQVVLTTLAGGAGYSCRWCWLLLQVVLTSLAGGADYSCRLCWLLLQVVLTTLAGGANYSCRWCWLYSCRWCWLYSCRWCWLLAAVASWFLRGRPDPVPGKSRPLHQVFGLQPVRLQDILPGQRDLPVDM